MRDVAADVSVIVVYWLTLCVRDMAWVFTGLNLSIRTMLDLTDTPTLVVSALQLSDTCDTTRVLITGPSVYIVGFFVFLLAYISRNSIFQERTCSEKRAFVCTMMTIALSTRASVNHRILFNTTKAAVYMLLCRVSDTKAGTWDTQARVCWSLCAYSYPLLLVAFMQVPFDAESYEISVKRKKSVGVPEKNKKIETWDVTV